MNGIQVERVSRRQGDEGVAGEKLIVRPVRRIRPFQHADPFRIANFLNKAIGEYIQPLDFQVRHPSIRVEGPVAIQVEVETEFIGAGCPVIGEHRRARQEEKVGDVLVEIVDRIQRVPVAIDIADVGRIGQSVVIAVIKPVRVDVIGGDEEAEVEGVGGC